MNPIVDGLGAKYAGRIKVVWQDIDNPATREMVQKYKVWSIPTLILVDGSGRVVDHQLGLQSPKVLEKAFSSLLQQ